MRLAASHVRPYMAVRNFFLFLMLAGSLQAQAMGERMGNFSAGPWFQETNGLQQSNAQQPVQSDCAADGFVVNAVTGEPVPRAHLSLMGRGGQTSTVADNAGRWSFSGVACGNIQVVATRPGFLPANRVSRPGQQLVVSSGSPLHDLKIQLTPQSVLTGKVVDEQGDPVMNAQVTAFTARVAMGRRTLQRAANANTNDLGEYRLPNLSAGVWTVCARANSPVENPASRAPDMVSAESCYPAPLEAGPASAMQLPEGRESKVDFTLTRMPAVHVRGTISGLPKNGGGGVTLVKRYPDGGISSYGAAMGKAGAFDIRGVTPGAYTIVTDYFETGKRLTARLPVNVGNSDVDGLAVQLEPGFMVTGAVRVESKSGVPAGLQFNMNLHSSDPTLGGGQLQWKDHSTFSVPDVPPGTYRLDAFVPPPYYLKSAMLGGRDLSREDVPITQSAGPIEIVVSDDGGSIEGQIQDANGQGLSSWAMLVAEGAGQPHNIMSGPDGHFKLANVAPGNYRVFAWDDVEQVEYADEDWMRRNGTGGVAVTIAAGQNQQVQLTQRPALPH